MSKDKLHHKQTLHKNLGKEKIGEISRVPSPSPTHQFIAQRLLLKLSSCNKQDEFLLLQRPVDLYLSEKTIYQPDLIVIEQKRNMIIQPVGIVEAPNIVIEVLSKTNEFFLRNIKYQKYEKFKIAEYWIVNPKNKEIEQYYLHKNKYMKHKTFSEKEIISSKQFNHLSIDLKHIFKN